MSGRLGGKTLIVTGAAQGIGAAVATCALAEGAQVIAADVAPIASSTDGRIVGRTLDVRSAPAWAALVEETIKAFGPINGLVNNAGVNVKYSPLDMPDDEWTRCLDINLRGAWLGCRAVLPGMLAQGGGSIVNIASVHGHQIIPGSFPYPVSKHGLIGLTRALGVEYAPRNVRVNAISPGYIDTAPCQDWWAAQADPAAARASSEALIPARRIGRADEVGMAAVFLLSDEAPYINATTLVVDGGRLAMFHE